MKNEGKPGITMKNEGESGIRKKKIKILVITKK